MQSYQRRIYLAKNIVNIAERNIDGNIKFDFFKLKI